MATALGTDDSVTTCDCCGKSNLKFTVAIELDSGDIVHYGQVCARRNTGKDQRTITSEINATKKANETKARLEYQATPEYAADWAIFAARDELARKTGVRLLGREAAEFVRKERDAANAVREAIAKKYNVCPAYLG